ncbi:tRNA pseudouridine(55) synthase TruB [Symbiobacterium thermophilum]|jgi:tRNA pseudouridine55 synthase|uniref:tRNA pseudouridine synthase B n=2 Tax=Symbiobacterium thermophilum TaxID=2734 RepID=TRUB_SYMTH|nr:tRNA pseudouridine(55) synthase TruB [Symbiobacterium thermophilum]Q67P83.1 RecName: Full=tRNA pseudouridine synthase B; AltName: Full=tRNA pseudouridine(55) synthase; Short=Psi55 synthase; AltName: Full=tRNA pseudouridylate synthase; AltName: Full=tRNA-uridine isomerase [Symbiobacterium thermophilum IAM 14863]BAD40510.1 tRNA pseudouridine 55 synthase [Symbiobacterium thermophilum IAM 14863]
MARAQNEAASEVDGVLNLLKPPGMTSHDVVAFVRRALGVKKAGHTGTLDPGVAGVLPVCVGRATRLAEYIAGSDKAYRAEITFGVATDTQDGFGEVVAEADASHLTRGDVAYALTRFHGPIEQVPPMVSAVKVGGKRLYELARKGVEVEREPRRVFIHRLQLLDFRPGPRPVAYIDVVCSKGTYVRTLAHDLGRFLQVGAHLSYLVRTRSGPFVLAQAATLEELAAGKARLLPPAAALGDMPRVTVSGRAAARVLHGVAPAVRVEHPDGTTVAVVAANGALLALAEADGGGLRLRKVFG